MVLAVSATRPSPLGALSRGQSHSFYTRSTQNLRILVSIEADLSLCQLGRCAQALTSQVPADNRFERDDACTFHKHGATLQLRAVLLSFCRHSVDVGGDEMVRYHIAQTIEPETRKLSEKCAFTRNSLRTRENT